MLDDVARDLRYALRMCTHNPAFTAVIVITLALGIGANTAVFSLVDTLILRSLPVRQPEQLVEPLFKYPRDPWLNLFRWSDYERIRRDNHVFSDLIALSSKSFQLTDPARGSEIVDGFFVSDNFFETLGLRPALGRLITTADGESKGATAVISWSYWKSRFNLDPKVLGQSLVVNAVPTTIVGVSPRGFFGLQLGIDPSLWLPAANEPIFQKPSHLSANWRAQDFSLVGRLKPGVRIDRAQAEMRVLDRARLTDLEAQTHDAQWRDVPLRLAPAGAGLSVLRERFGGSLHLMMAAVSVLLLLACLNIASMLLARGAARHREMAVRVALGAGRFRVVQQMMTESLLLSTFGGLCGVLVAYVGARALIALIASGRSPVGMPQPLQIPVQVDLRVMLFAAGIAVITGLLFGLVPAWRAFVSAPSSSLREIGSAGETRRWKRFGQALVVAQVALSLVLLTAAVLFVRYLSDLRTVGLGFQTDSVLQLRLDWSRSGYSPEQRKSLSRQLLDRLASIGGVRSATLAAMTPTSGVGGGQYISVPGFSESAENRRRVNLNAVAAKYFETLATPLLAGRDFAPEDDGRPQVAIVNRAMARYYFGTSDPVGRHFTVEGQTEPIEIVGVVADAKYNDVHDKPPRTIYRNAFQGNGGATFLLLRTNVAPTSIISGARRAVRELVPTVAIANVTTLAEQVDASILPERLMAMLSQLFGMTAALLVGIGLYGLLAYTIARRVKEIGLRVAIGATSRDVIGMVLTSGLTLVSAGLIVGVPTALWMNRYAANALATVASSQAETPTMPPTNLLVPVVIASVAIVGLALVASYLPARRAIKVDPIAALRTE